MLELDSGETLAESNAILLFLARARRTCRRSLWTRLASGNGSSSSRTSSSRTSGARGSGASPAATSSDARPGKVHRRPEWPRSGSSNATPLGTSFWSAVATPWPTSASTAYTHAAHEGEIDLEPLPAVRAWLARVESQPGFVNDLEPYARGPRGRRRRARA